MKYDLVDLKLLVSIAEVGNVTLGAAACFLSPSAASLRLRNLEEAMGTSLFERHARGVRSTEAGRVMVNHARACMQGLHAMHVDLAEHIHGAKSSVRVFANCTSAAARLLDDIQPFLERYPDVRVSVDERESSEIIAAVASRKADLGIVLDGMSHPDLLFHDYRVEELVVIAPSRPEYLGLASIEFIECLAHPMVCLSEGAPLQRQLEAHAKALGLHLPARVNVSSFASMIRLVRSGVGIGIVPEEALTDFHHETLHTIRLEDGWSTRRLKLCAPKSSARVSRSTHMLCEHLSAVASQQEVAT